MAELTPAGPGYVLIGGEALARAAWLLDTAVAIAERDPRVMLTALDREVVTLFHRQALTVKAHRERARLDDLAELADTDADPEELTALEAAVILGKAERTVTHRAQVGTLPGWKRGRAWFFDRDQVERIAAEERATCR